MNMQNPYEGLIKTIDVILRKAELEDGKTLAFLITELPLSDEPVSPASYIKFFQRLKESGAIKDFSVMEMGRRPHAFTLIQPNKGKLRETEARAEKWLELTEKTFHFATYARKAFLFAKGKEGLELKKEILMGLGELPIIKDQMLSIAPHEWLQPFENDYRPLKEEYLGLELDKKPLTKAQTEALASVRARWLPGLDSDQDTRLQRAVSYR